MKKNVITPMRRAMRRGIASMLLICGMCQPALAEEQSLLTLLFNDGHKQSYVLASRPKVTFDASTLYVASEDVKDEYVLADVSKFVFDRHNGKVGKQAHIIARREVFTRLGHVVLLIKLA